MKVLKKWIAGLVIIGMITGIFADSKNMISTSYAAEECGVSEQSEVTVKDEVKEEKPPVQKEEVPKEEEKPDKKEPGKETEKEDQASEDQKPEEQESDAQESDTQESEDQISENPEEETGEVSEEELEETQETSIEPYEDDNVIIQVEEGTESLPEGVRFHVTPIERHEEAYKSISKRLLDTIESEDQELGGFLAYDISFLNEEGEEVEPDGNVKVSISYKNVTIPGELKNADEKHLQVSVMHLEENQDGAVKEVVDLSKRKQVEKLETTQKKEIKDVEFVSNSFSVYTIVWRYSTTPKITFHYVNESGNDIFTSGNESITFQSGNRSAIPLAIRHFEGYRYKNNYVQYQNLISAETVRVDNIGGLSYTDSRLYYYKNGFENSNRVEIGKKEIDVYLVYEKASSGSSGSTLENLSAPEHHKWIKYNSNDDYTLTLDVKGSRSAGSGVDILLVLDGSGSMSGTLLSKLKEQVNKFAKKALDGNDVNRMAAVGFSSEGYSANSFLQSWTKDSATMISKVDNLSANGGTNWQNAMIRADAMLKSAGNGNEKYVIFISDGQPTFRYYGYDGIAGGKGSETGAGNSDDGRNFDAAVAQFELSSVLRSTEMYAMYLTSDTQSAMEKFANATGAHKANGIGEKFDTTMEEIANRILYNAYEDVEIKDTLSEYVEIAEGSQWEVTKNNEPLDDSKYELTTSGKSVSLKIKEELEAGAVYQMSIHIQPSMQAYREYLENGYAHVGDSDTDAPGNDTSSGKEGFFANAYEGTDDQKALLIYKQKTKTNKEQTKYHHPVVQVTKSAYLNPLPDAGGNGTLPYVFLGMVMMMAALINRLFFIERSEK